jgi:poly(3-hydroxybutyrate) depolymerase
VFYRLYELQRWATAPLLAALRLPGEAVQPWHRPIWAVAEVLARSVEAAEPRAEPIEAAVAADLGRPLEAASLHATPFVRVVRLRLHEGQGPPVLLMAPYSGYSAAVLSGLVCALLAEAEVWITDWVDARLVPMAAGPFRLADQAALCREVLALAGRPLHLLGLSQSVPVVMAAAVKGPPVASLILLGGPADPCLDPTPLQRAMSLVPAEALMGQLTSIVAGRHTGAGRRVFPAVYQLLAYAGASPSVYVEAQAGLLAELATGIPNGRTRQHADMHRLLDVPAELFAGTVEHAVRTPMPLPPGGGLAGAPLLTVEAGADGLVGPGQTHAAHGRLAPYGVVSAGRCTVRGAHHHDLFTGPRFHTELAPMLRAFVASLRMAGRQSS